MSNSLTLDTQQSIIGALCEGCSIRGVERMTGVHRDTIMRLGARVGEACQSWASPKLTKLSLKHLEIDELWGFIERKEKRVRGVPLGVGDIYTFIALDAATKLIPAWMVGRRDTPTTDAFIEELASRLQGRPQLSTDGFIKYKGAIERSFGCQVDYGQLVKMYSIPKEKAEAPERRYSQPTVTAVERVVLQGSISPKSVCTSHVEKQNHSVRMHCRRLMRLTNGFSKKLDNLKAAVGMTVFYHNFVKFHSAIRMTPAMAAGVVSGPLTVREMVEIDRS